MKQMSANRVPDGGAPQSGAGETAYVEACLAASRPEVCSPQTFNMKVYAVVKQIPKGKVTTYGEIALLCGSPRASRAVGWALHRNPDPGETTPCHRVVNREGRLAPAFAFGGIDAQRLLLEAEGVEVSEEGYVSLKKYAWHACNTGNSETDWSG